MESGKIIRTTFRLGGTQEESDFQKFLNSRKGGEGRAKLIKLLILVGMEANQREDEDIRDG